MVERVPAEAPHRAVGFEQEREALAGVELPDCREPRDSFGLGRAMHSSQSGVVNSFSPAWTTSLAPQPYAVPSAVSATACEEPERTLSQTCSSPTRTGEGAQSVSSSSEHLPFCWQTPRVQSTSVAHGSRSTRRQVTPWSAPIPRWPHSLEPKAQRAPASSMAKAVE